MLTRIYKNNNFTIKREAGDETAANLQELVWIIANYCDDLTLDYYEPCNYGNSYAVYECEIWCNGAPRYYHIRPEFVDQYNAGRVVRVEYRENVPRFIMPPYHYYAAAIDTTTGQKGTMYHLNNAPDENTAEFMQDAGCKLTSVYHKYAPELKYTAVFVPNGVCFEFC